MSKKLVFYLHQSPPVHGASIVGDQVAQYVAKQWPGAPVRQLGLSEDLSSISSLSVFKLFRAFYLLSFTLIDLLRGRTGFFYTPAISHGGILKDILILFPVLLFLHSPLSRRYFLLLHVHARGVDSIVRKGSIWRLLINFLFSKSDLLLLSPRHGTDFKNIRCRRIFYCNNFSPVDIASLHHVSDLDRDRPKFGWSYTYLSNLYRSKGVLEAIEIFSKVGGENDRLSIAGPFVDGEVTADEITNYIVELGLHKQVDILGPIYGDDKNLLLSKTDVFLFPTRYDKEVFPLVLLEALSVGAYLISTDTGGIADIIDDELIGLLLGNASINRDSIALMLSADAKAERSLIAQKRYSIAAYFQRFDSILRELVHDCEHR